MYSMILATENKNLSLHNLRQKSIKILNNQFLFLKNILHKYFLIYYLTNKKF